MSARILDPRLHAYQDDIIDAELEDYAEGRQLIKAKRAQIIEPIISLKKAPRFDLSIETQALYGETIKVFDEKEGWSWVQLERDGYVGYISSDSYTEDIRETTHWVHVPRTFVYPAPSIKTPPLKILHMNSEISICQEVEQFVELTTGGFIYASHVSNHKNRPNDFSLVAKQFLNTPYLWGGKSGNGIDCSGLIQISLWATGQKAPRDSDMQENQLGTLIGQDIETASLQSGDLIFWKGHVGVMQDAKTLIHANGYHMNTIAEPVEKAVQRIANMYGLVTSVKRL